MKQLITRLDDELHEQLKRRAAAEDRSVNALVVDVLRSAVASYTPRESVRDRARHSNRLVVPPQPAHVPSREAVARATHGTGATASEALAAERSAR
jgi:plasmid stability protein